MTFFAAFFSSKLKALFLSSLCASFLLAHTSSNPHCLYINSGGRVFQSREVVDFVVCLPCLYMEYPQRRHRLFACMHFFWPFLPFSKFYFFFFFSFWLIRFFKPLLVLSHHPFAFSYLISSLKPYPLSFILSIKSSTSSNLSPLSFSHSILKQFLFFLFFSYEQFFFFSLYHDLSHSRSLFLSCFFAVHQS